MLGSDQLMARLGLDTAGFKAGLKEAHSAFRQFAGGVGIGLSVAGIAQATREVIDYGGRVYDLGKRYEVSTKAVQQFGNAAEQNGSSLEGMAKGFNKLDIAISKALAGNEKITKAFAHLGITVADLRTLSPEELMLKLGRSSLNAADMVTVLGKSALELRPTLEGLGNGTIALGDAIDNHLIRELKEAQKNLAKFDQWFMRIRANEADNLFTMGAAWKAIGKDIAGATTALWGFFKAATTDWSSVPGALRKFNQELPGHAQWREEATRRSFSDYDFDSMPGSPQWLARHNIKAGPPDKKSRAQLAAEQKDRERYELSLKDLTENGPASFATGTPQMAYAAQQARLLASMEAQIHQYKLTGISATGEIPEARLDALGRPLIGDGLIARTDALRQTLPIKESEKEVGIYSTAFKTALDSSTVLTEIRDELQSGLE